MKRIINLLVSMILLGLTSCTQPVSDTQKPVIELYGETDITIYLWSDYTEEGAAASDNIDGDLSSSVVISGDKVNTDIPGVYTIRYNVTDSAGNTAVEVLRNVNVVRGPLSEPYVRQPSEGFVVENNATTGIVSIETELMGIEPDLKDISVSVQYNGTAIDSSAVVVAEVSGKYVCTIEIPDESISIGVMTMRITVNYDYQDINGDTTIFSEKEVNISHIPVGFSFVMSNEDYYNKNWEPPRTDNVDMFDAYIKPTLLPLIDPADSLTITNAVELLSFNGFDYYTYAEDGFIAVYTSSANQFFAVLKVNKADVLAMDTQFKTDFPW